MDSTIRTMQASPWTLYAEAARQGRLLYQVDPATGRAFFPPRAIAPSAGLPENRLSLGRGTIYSVTCVTARTGPRILALVDLDEGFRVLARVEGAGAEGAAIGLRVALRPSDAETPLMLAFEPIAGP